MMLSFKEHQNWKKTSTIIKSNESRQSWRNQTKRILFFVTIDASTLVGLVGSVLFQMNEENKFEGFSYNSIILNVQEQPTLNSEHKTPGYCMMFKNIRISTSIKHFYIRALHTKETLFLTFKFNWTNIPNLKLFTLLERTLPYQTYVQELSQKNNFKPTHRDINHYHSTFSAF